MEDHVEGIQLHLNVLIDHALQNDQHEAAEILTELQERAVDAQYELEEKDTQLNPELDPSQYE